MSYRKWIQIVIGIFLAPILMAVGNMAVAGGIVTGQLAPEQEPLRCAVFAYQADKAPTSPYAAPLFAASCATDGSFSISLPEGAYLIGAGISIGGHTWAAQPDPVRRLPLAGPQAQKIIVRDGMSYRLKAKSIIASQLAAATQTVTELPPPAARRTTPVTLTGSVRDNVGRPVVHAVVQLLEAGSDGGAVGRARYLSAPSDDDGKYRIEGVAPERFVVGAFKSDPILGFLAGETAELDMADPKIPLAIDIFIRSASPAPLTDQRVVPPVNGNGTNATAGDAGKAVEPLRGPDVDPSSL